MKITVITVCLNSRNTIEKTIKSVIAQLGQEWELEYIVVDGGSEDGTLDVLEKYSAYIDQCVSEPDRGIFDAMNKGIGMAAGDVIAFLNSDDWYEGNVAGSVVEAFGDGEYDCVCFDNYVLGKCGQREYFDASRYSIEDLHVQMIYYHSSIFCRKEFFKQNNNFELGYKFAADYDWFLNIVEQGARVRYVHKPVFTFRYGGISSVNEIECAREARRVALCHLPDDKEKYRYRIDGRLCEIVLCTVESQVFYPMLIDLLGRNRINILWGAGARGKQWAEWFRKTGIKIDAIVDSDHVLWDSFIGQIPVRPPWILNELSCNVIITPEQYADEIKTIISSAGNNNIRVFEMYAICRTLAESVIDGLFE